MKITTFFTILFILSISIHSQKKKIEIKYERKSDRSIDFYYKKNVPGSYYLTLKFDNLENCHSSKIYKKVVKYDSGSLFTLEPSNKNKGISFSYKIKYIIGNPKPEINENITYVLPFKTGKFVKIVEASNVGEKYFGSKKPVDWKSFIVYSNQPDTIYSMRKGIVVKIIDKYENDEKFKKTYTSKRNRILIEHKDGTYATYKGFDKNQIFVKLGQKVYPHTILGKLEKFNKTNYRLDFNTFHYLENLLEDTENTLKKRNHKTKYLNPKFYIDNVVKKIESRQNYNVSFNEGIKLQEFSRREKKKYEKKPKEFE
ncbi:M23 family metallopeptidase [Polaribacter sp.]|nr:M23 family metallopeptidase [Polaribacter sp.]